MSAKDNKIRRSNLILIRSLFIITLFYCLRSTRLAFANAAEESFCEKRLREYNEDFQQFYKECFQLPWGICCDHILESLEDRVRQYRILCPGGSILEPYAVGQRVLSRWTNNLYYKGRVSAVSKGMIYIQIDDSDTEKSYQINDISAVIRDTIPLNVEFKEHVIASQKGGKKYYIGFVIKVDQSRGYNVRFDDNDEAWYSKENLTKFPYVSSPHALRSRVFARWGFVTKVSSSTVFINYDDGDTITLPINDPSAVIADNLPACNEIQLGQKVIGYWPSRKRYYPGTVSAISSEYFVQFDDGDKRWNAIFEIRTYPHA